MEKYGTSRQATDDNIIWYMRFVCRKIKATDTHSEYVILTDLQREKIYFRKGLNITLYVHLPSYMDTVFQYEIF